MKLKELILEGMYDKLTGEITKDLMRELKNAIKSGMKNKPYKGYKVRENPKKGYNVLAMLEDETDTIEIGDYSDKVSGVNLSVELKYKLTDDVKPGNFYINGYADEILWSNLELLLATNPKDGVNILSKVNSYIRETVRHEIEHFTQRGDNVKIGKFIRNNKAIRKKIADNPNIGYKYLILPDEVDANIHGLYARAKNTKQPYQKVVDSYLDSFVESDDITPQQRDIVYKVWKNRIPKIGGIPKLK
jgi:hypothetical protein